MILGLSLLAHPLSLMLLVVGLLGFWFDYIGYQTAAPEDRPSNARFVFAVLLMVAVVAWKVTAQEPIPPPPIILMDVCQLWEPWSWEWILAGCMLPRF